VAVKVLPDAFALDADRLARFMREAQVLAALNHPNIATIYGIEGNALIMELVDGEDLSEMIGVAGTDDAPRGGGLSLANAIPIARQIADALEAAHEQGIVHRDLKPQNIKVRADGMVKVLDFGLAKAVTSSTSGSQDASTSPTVTVGATQMGTILGTAAYMAPEQARGRAVDRRADIWAFGIVLYEMLTGRRAFGDSDSVQDVLAAVLRDDVKWDALPADLPSSVRRLLRRCLQKDPKRRLSSIGDARLELDEATGKSDADALSAPASRLGGAERIIWASVAVMAIGAAAWMAFGSRAAPAPDPPLTRFNVFPPDGGRFSGGPPRTAVSPAGRSIVFAATPTGKPDQLYIRRLDSVVATPVPGTESNADGTSPQSPFWSPDGRHLGFFVQVIARGKQTSRLRVVDLQSGAVQTLCDLPLNNAGGTWNAEGVILVSSQETKGIHRLSSDGGALTPVTTLDASRGEIVQRFPQFLADGRHFIYQSQTQAADDLAIFIGSLDSPDRRLLIRSEYARFAAPNNLLFTRGAELLGQVLDPATLQLQGEPVVLANGLTHAAGNGRAGFSVSDSGVLVYSNDAEAGTAAANRHLTWLDRTGKPVGPATLQVSSLVVRLSPDATRVALLEDIEQSGIQGRSLWVAELERPLKTPLTTGGIRATSPTWSHDGLRVLFGLWDGPSQVSLAERAASGATPARIRRGDAGSQFLPIDESADGAHVVFLAGLPGARTLNVLATADNSVKAYVPDESDQVHAALSPNGKWLAYAANESGVHQVIVRPFPDPSLGKWQISTNGGLAPRWRKDGRELFYVDAEQRLIAVEVNTAGQFKPGRSTPLFVIPTPQFTTPGAAYSYDADLNGQRFLVSMFAGPSSGTSILPITVATNWTSLLKKAK
jgi:Tol biopolymer transport system component